MWDPATDELKVRVDVDEKPCTRRGLLTMIAKTYDLLGVIQPFLLPARQLLQLACSAQLGWDESIGVVPGLELRWRKWFKSLPDLQQVSVPRCFLLKGKEVREVELHAFSDASSHGYGACVYIRCVYSDASVQCSLVMGKSRVAPLKRVTVSRLELVAAVLSAKLCSVIQNEMDFSFSRVCFWTDASVVLRYILNSSSRFETFVANRIEQLHNMTSPDQWRLVPGTMNPADIASHGLFPEKVKCADLWFFGPPFLMQTCDQWPEQPSFLPDLTDEDCGVKKHMTICCFNLIKTSKDTLGRLFARYSSLDQLELVVARLLRFWSFLYAKRFNPESRPAGGHITAEERRVAMNAILRAVQKQSFSKVLSVIPERPQYDERSTITEDMLKRCKELKVLQRLTPFISHGFLRVGGRLRNSFLPFDAKYPILLPHSHPVTGFLIVCHHEREGHMGVNHVLADINQQY